MSKGMLIIISGPSGSGKGTVVKKLDPEKGFALSISMTTRSPRQGEVDGKDYFFTTREKFMEIRRNNGFLEHAEFVGNMYGTPISYVKEQINMGKNVILEIDVNGALQVQEVFEECVLIFLMPPTMKELENRLVCRNTEDLDTIKKRLRRANDEIEMVEQYDYLVINESINQAVEDIYTIVKSEKKRPKRCINIINNFKGEIEC
ncbi:MAG: guanylate kinase [Lachnospirales bacterium]